MFNIKTIAKSALLPYRQKYYLPQTLILFVTSKCNARCDFCFYKNNIANTGTKESELTVSEIQKIARNYGKLHYLALAGGEPFIRKDLGAICQAFIDHSDTSVIDIPSNFYFADNILQTIEPLVCKNPNVIFDLVMSIDHVGEAHDISRKVPNLYQTAIKSFLAVSQLQKKYSNLRVKINIVYLKQNSNDINKIVAELDRNLRFDRIQITYPHFMVPQEWDGESPVSKDVKAYIKSTNTALENISNNNRFDLYTLGMLSVKKIYHHLLYEAIRNKKNLGSYCEAGRNIVVINEQGEVFPCESLWQSIGNLRSHNYDMKVILSGDKYQEFRNERLGIGKCNCTWSCAFHSAIALRPRYLPWLGFNALQIILKKF